MNPEERLSEALHATLDTRRPSPDLADRIVDRLSVGPQRTNRLNLRLSLAAVAALVLVAALVPLALNLRSNAPATPSELVGALTHYHRGDLSFDAPATWGYEPDLGDRNGATLWSGKKWAGCAPLAVQCGPWPLDPGQVLVEVSKSQVGSPPYVIDPTDPAGLGAGEKYVTVGGLPAIFKAGGQPDSDSGASLDWRLSVPGDATTQFSIHAEYKNPGADQLRAQVEALVASIRYDQPAAVLDPADGPSVTVTGLDQLRATDPSYSCFPNVPGATATASVTSLSFVQLTKPLPVTCGIAVEPVAIGLWRVTLTESWTAASDRSAGSLTTTVWLNPDGTQNSLELDPRLRPLPGSQLTPLPIPYQ